MVTESKCSEPAVIVEHILLEFDYSGIILILGIAFDEAPVKLNNQR
jgi:hypothetical protein